MKRAALELQLALAEVGDGLEAASILLRDLPPTARGPLAFVIQAVRRRATDADVASATVVQSLAAEMSDDAL
jgi:hypothetical protein